jgi:signal transduction histidine kinase
MSKPSWLVVVDPCGKVMAVAGGVPEAWASAAAPEELETSGPGVAEAARQVAAAVRAGAPRARSMVTRADADVEVLALPAIALARHPSNVRAVVGRALAPFRAQAQSRDVLLREDDQIVGRLVVDVDVAKMTWVVATLVGNALRFVRTGSRHTPGGTITIRHLHEGDRVIIEVDDDGPGMEPVELARLFDPGVGTALALAMARDVVLAHGGALVVDSSTSPEAHGTRVRIELPVQPDH